MKKMLLFFFSITVVLLFCSVAAAGHYAPAAGEPCSTAIHMDNSSFIAWATGIDVVRGYMDISDLGGGYASYGAPANALGKANGNSYDVVSLGDGGYATLTFAKPIVNGPGWDFAVFENGFSDAFLELGFVEVSSDGDNFFRFDSISLTQTDTQVDGFGTLDTTDLHNFAGKYRQGYGTPFDLDEFIGTWGLDVDNIGWVRVIDVVGNIDGLYAEYDSLGNKVNDPWPTDFASSGFDLDVVGVINAVPIPGAVWLLGSGLLGLVCIRRRKTTS